MKRLILRVVVMLLAFAFGVGINRLFWRPAVDSTPKVEAVSVPPFEPQREIVPAAPPPAPAPAATPKPYFIYETRKFVVYGAFYMMEPKPKEFADFDVLEMELTGTIDGYRGFIAVTTRSEDYKYDDASATFALVTDQRLFFATEPMREADDEYRFDGVFLRKDLDSVAGKKKAVLRGTLTKSKNGRKIAERTVSFWMEHMGC